MTRAGRLFVLTLGAIGLSACSTAPMNDSARASLTVESRGTIAGFTSRDPSLGELMNRSVGYAAFPSIGKAGLIGGGAYGRGEVYQDGILVGWADISHGSIGPQIGAQSYDELIVFMTQRLLDSF